MQSLRGGMEFVGGKCDTNVVIEEEYKMKLGGQEREGSGGGGYKTTDITVLQRYNYVAF